MKTYNFRKLRLWRLLAERSLNQIAREVRLPPYVVSAIERGEVEPSERWVQRFEAVYGEAAARELLAPVEPLEALGPASGSSAMRPVLRRARCDE